MTNSLNLLSLNKRLSDFLRPSDSSRTVVTPQDQYREKDRTPVKEGDTSVPERIHVFTFLSLTRKEKNIPVVRMFLILGLEYWNKFELMEYFQDRGLCQRNTQPRNCILKIPLCQVKYRRRKLWWWEKTTTNGCP